MSADGSGKWTDAHLWYLAEQISQRADELRADGTAREPTEDMSAIEHMAHMIAGFTTKKDAPVYSGNVIPFRKRGR